MKIESIVAILVTAAVVVSGVWAFSAPASSASPSVERTYATDADFREGVSVGVEIAENQLQLSRELLTLSLPFIWVPNDEGTVSKVHTETGDELGRYRVVPPDLPDGGNPSRTTVDLEGNVWVGLRTAGTVVKIGLCESGQCIDRNEDGIIQTSWDLDGDGDITGDELLPWGEDECVLLEVVLVPGHEGAYAPGTYEGPYDTNFWGTSPRSLAVDAHNNLWVGTGDPQHKYFYIDGATGEILDIIDVSHVTPPAHCAYGATIDRNGILWAIQRNCCPAEAVLLRIDPSGPEAIRVFDLPYDLYGLTVDYLGHLFLTCHEDNKFFKIDVETDEIIWVKDIPEVTHRPDSGARGVAITAEDHHVWVAVTYRNSVLRYDNDGNLLVEIEGFANPSGVAVDAAGKIWVTDMGSEYIHRIDPETNVIDLSKRIIGGGGHYSYSDMTGAVSRTITTKIGTWTAVYDSGHAGTLWGTISWTGDEPEGTLIKAEMRSSHDQSTWSAWEAAHNGVPLTRTPDGRYVEIRVTLQIVAGERSPILYDLTVESAVPVTTYTLTLSSTDGGSVTSPGEGAFSYDEGTAVSLRAEAEEGYQFVNWTGDVHNIADVGAASTAVTMNGDYSIIANLRAVGGCLIATATYGTPMADEVQVLRAFRDEYLVRNPFGRGFVAFYYKVSPPIAEFITEHPGFKPVVRVGLMPAVVMSAMVVNTTPAEKMAIVGSLVLVSVALAVWWARRRSKGPQYG